MNDDPIDREVLGRLDFGEPPGDVLRMLVASFLEHSTATAMALAEAGQQGDAAAVERSAHALKSSARQFGALHLGDLCEALEVAGRNGAVDREAVATATEEFERVRAALVAL